MLRKIVLVNLLVVSLLMIGCGQTESSNSANAADANKTMSNSNNSVPTPGPSSTAAPSSNINSSNTARPLGTPAKENKIPPGNELGNDAQKENVNDNATPQRKPRISERKPPEREKPE